MMNESRSYKSLLNAQIGLIFYLVTLALSFVSRKIFLDNLGVEFIGLTGTLTNILGFLNLAEFGIGSAISFFLYKPLQIADRGRISELISIFGYVYRKIGCMIGAGGIVVSLFFPLIFKQTPMEFGQEDRLGDRVGTWDIGVLGSLGATDAYGVQGGEQLLLSLGGVF